MRISDWSSDVCSSDLAVLLDGRPLRTPAKALLILPTEPLAAAIAAEWQGQGEEVDPQAMPLNALACNAIDIVAPATPQPVADLLGFAGHHLPLLWTGEPSEHAARHPTLLPPLADP